MQILHASGILGELPRLFLIDEFVDLVRKLHHDAGGASIFADFVEALHFSAACTDAFKQRILHDAVVHPSFELLENEASGAACVVDVLADEVGVDALQKVGLRKIDVRGHLRGKVVAKPFGIHAEFEILQRRNAGASALAHLFAVNGHEAVSIHMIGHAERLA